MGCDGERGVGAVVSDQGWAARVGGGAFWRRCGKMGSRFRQDDEAEQARRRDPGRRRGRHGWKRECQADRAEQAGGVVLAVIAG